MAEWWVRELRKEGREEAAALVYKALLEEPATPPKRKSKAA
jgi:hypothetical protein